jgi:PhnB protein
MGGELMANVVAAHLVVDDPERAAAWYGTVFGAQEIDRIPLPDGSIFAIDLAIGDTTVALAGEYPDMGIISPRTLGGTYLALVVPTENTEFRPISDTFYGARAGQFIDPFGHRWGVSQHLRDVPREERDAAVAAMFSSG